MRVGLRGSAKSWKTVNAGWAPAQGMQERDVLDAFIIDELRRREKGEQEDAIRPRLELPLDDRRPPPPNNGNGDHRDEDDDDGDRGVVIIDL